MIAPARVEGAHGLGKPPLGQVARRLPLPVHPLPRDLGDLGRAVPLPQLGKQPAALDAGQLPVVARQHQLGPAWRAAASSAPVTGVSSIAASSTTTTVRRSQVVRPFFSLNRAACTVPASANPSAARSCATALVGARPTTRLPSRWCASRIAASV